MPTRESMLFSRKTFDSDACIQYSWVPHGKRHTIKLIENNRVGASTEDYDNASKVQVYSLRNGRVGRRPADWTFPPGPAPKDRVVVGAVVHIVEKTALGYVIYDDGLISQVDKINLDEVPPFGCDSTD